MIEAATWLGVLVGAVALLVAISRSSRRRPGAAAAGTIYDLLQEDKRKALEIIVEERAGARDPEHADDEPPDASADFPFRGANPSGSRGEPARLAPRNPR